MAVASHELDESKKREVIGFLMDEMGIMPTEKDKKMVRLAEWEEDQPIRKAFEEFLVQTKEPGKKEKPSLFSPEIDVKIWKELVPEPLLPEAPKEKEED